MDERITKFLTRHRIAVLTTLLEDGSPHSATVHYAVDIDNLSFYFLSEKRSRKLSGLNEEGKSSLVVGFSEEEWLTFQAEGNVNIVTESEHAWKIYTEKYKGSDNAREDEDTVVLKFTPTWWRYSEVKPRPSVILSSE